ncbi:MAG: tetratricopeptide repeat protein, partial [bacterium]
ELTPNYADAYSKLADAFKGLKKLDEAEHLMKLLIEANPEDAYAYYGLGYVYQLQSKWKEGLDSQDRAIKLNPNLLEAYLSKANILLYTNEFEDALKTHLTGRKLAEKRKDLVLQVKFLAGIGISYIRLGDYPEAMDHLNRALQIATDIGEKGDEGRLLGRIASIYVYESKYFEALEKFEPALKIARELGDKKSEGTWLGSMGAVYMQLGDYAKALEYFKIGLQLARDIEDKRVEMINLANIASTYGYLGDYSKALKYHEATLNIAEEMGDTFIQQKMLANIGLDYGNSGDYHKAVMYSQQALELARSTGDKNTIELLLRNIGAFYENMGHNLKALEYHHQALDMAKSIGDRRGEGVSLENIGFVYRNLKEYSRALEYYAQALEIFTQIKDKKNRANTLGNIGLVYFEQGENSKAMEHCKNALRIFEEMGYKFGAGYQMNNLGDIHLELKDYSASAKYFRGALIIGDEINAPMILWRAHGGLARTYEKERNFEDALWHYKLAVEAIESIRSRIEVEELKSIFLEREIDVYRKLIDLLSRLHRKDPSKGYDKEAFHYAERARARSFLDILAESRVDIRRGVDPVLLDREREIFRNMTKIHNELRGKELSEVERKEVYDRLKSEEEKLTALRWELRQKSPAYANLTYPEPLNLPQVQKRTIKEGKTILEYFLGPEQSYLWAITARRTDMYQLPPEGEIKESVEGYLT